MGLFVLNCASQNFPSYLLNGRIPPIALSVKLASILGYTHWVPLSSPAVALHSVSVGLTECRSWAFSQDTRPHSSSTHQHYHPPLNWTLNRQERTQIFNRRQNITNKFSNPALSKRRTEKIPHRPRSIARELIPCRSLNRRGWNPCITSWPDGRLS